MAKILDAFGIRQNEWYFDETLRAIDVTNESTHLYDINTQMIKYDKDNELLLFKHVDRELVSGYIPNARLIIEDNKTSSFTSRVGLNKTRSLKHNIFGYPENPEVGDRILLYYYENDEIQYIGNDLEITSIQGDKFNFTEVSSNKLNKSIKVLYIKKKYYNTSGNLTTQQSDTDPTVYLISTPRSNYDVDLYIDADQVTAITTYRIYGT